MTAVKGVGNTVDAPDDQGRKYNSLRRKSAPTSVAFMRESSDLGKETARRSSGSFGPELDDWREWNYNKFNR